MNSEKKSRYLFLWGDYQPHLTIELNINSFMKFSNIPWNNVKNIIQLSRKNVISCFHSKEDFQKDEELGKKFLDNDFSRKFISDLENAYRKHWEFFNSFKKIDFSSLSKEEIFESLINITDNWSLIIAYFRASQEKPVQYLIKEIKKYLSEKETAIIMISSDLDLLNREQIDWQELLKQEYSKEKLLKHAGKYPWLVMCHFTYDDVIDTLTQRYNNDKKHLKFKDIVKEKQELKEKQEKIINKAPQLRFFINLLQRLALSRMEIKSCWAGMDFYLIPLIDEISKRTGESIKDIYKFYLINDIKNLLFEDTKLSEEEKKKRKECFVGLWKNGKVIYRSGKEAEELTREELEDLYEIKKVDEIKGTAANPGKIRGIARILEANNLERTRKLREDFQKGQILITQMTQPSIMDIAMNASALVTDEGGMLSHAAIISRELKIPCVVGTYNATKIFNDGDLIEVDANKGIVRKIN
ncbi:hypothetical protein KY343_01380, partial [Candidatus Woesearchaeota archaeon]|nr:hypothetical protein [Candidatus Woesearchaeota archaeon]